MKRIAFATYSKRPHISSDDQLAADLLKRMGHEVHAAAWDDASINWQSMDAVILRSVWNYYLKYDEFLNWLKELPIAVWNEKNQVRWNSSKTYLAELEAKGIPIVPTRFASGNDLTEQVRSLGWNDLVLKPAVSADGFLTHRFSLAEIRPGNSRLLAYARLECPTMIQPFLEEITRVGEWSFLFFDGEFSHALLKTPSKDDFRVQETYGGKTSSAECDPLRLEAARRVLRQLPVTPLYARVDMIEREGKMLLSELEVIEPSLYLRHSPSGAERFASAILKKLS